MGYVRLNDDAIWVRRIEGDKALREEILALPGGVRIELEVDGVTGTWEKMKDGKDGRPTNGLRPIGPMRDVWKSMQARRGDWLEIRKMVCIDPYLMMVESTLTEWNSPEDDEAYRDLPLQ